MLLPTEDGTTMDTHHSDVFSFEAKLPAIMESFRDTFKNTGGRITAENLKV